MDRGASAQVAERPAGRAGDAALPRFRSPDELREVLDLALRSLDGDERRGPLLRAAGMRMRFSFPDVSVVLNVSASSDPDHHLRWAFSDDVDWDARLDLTMDSETLNSYLQGGESLAVDIARGRIRCRGDAHVALLYVPATRLMIEPYRELVRSEYPHLALA
jgi:hypothetical protein